MQGKPITVQPYFAEGRSYDPPPEEIYQSETEFGRLVQRLDLYDVLETIDELLETLRVMEPRLYNAFMRKLTALK